jgi:hypothetical protein
VINSITKRDEPIFTGLAAVKVMLRPARSQHKRASSYQGTLKINQRAEKHNRGTEGATVVIPRIRITAAGQAVWQVRPSCEFAHGPKRCARERDKESN